MPARTIGFVWGYLPGVDRQAKTAADAGLSQRFSLAFNRYPDSAPALHIIEFDRDLVVNTVRRLLRLFPHDSLVAIDWNGQAHSSLSDACLPDKEDGGHDPFGAVRLAREGSLVCYVEHEAYEYCGGPHPYHDAFVYAFYCNDMERNRVQKALFAHAAENDTTISDVVSAATRPVKLSWLRRLFNRLP